MAVEGLLAESSMGGREGGDEFAPKAHVYGNNSSRFDPLLKILHLHTITRLSRV